MLSELQIEHDLFLEQSNKIPLVSGSRQNPTKIFAPDPLCDFNPGGGQDFRTGWGRLYVDVNQGHGLEQMRSIEAVSSQKVPKAN